jgi:hypothetical protein
MNARAFRLRQSGNQPEAETNDEEVDAMQIRRRIRGFKLSAVALVSIVAVALAATSASGDPRNHGKGNGKGKRRGGDEWNGSRVLPLSLCAPGRNSFSTNVDNPFFPLPDDRQWVYVGVEEDTGESIGLQITVLEGTETFYENSYDIETVRVEEMEWLDANGDGVFDEGEEELLEISVNYFAETRSGTVCYFGEDVDIYEGGEVVSHEGAWRADDPGNAPGIFMPAYPEVGMTFQQEVAPGIAEDSATIVEKNVPVETTEGTFRGTIIVEEFTPLEPGSVGTKAYAKKVGLIQDGDLLLLSY